MKNTTKLFMQTLALTSEAIFDTLIAYQEIERTTLHRLFRIYIGQPSPTYSYEV
ncbi:MAG: hypothetical protein RBS09_03285 [Anaerolineaceae bacterium]|jgi:hypothetical protein|nr:hypothetical protein [Anaerolineaceae bacterium]